MININNLSVSFSNQKVLDDISLNLPKNGLVAVVGPSGCGKTTLFNCISGLIDYSGEIEINGINLENIPLTKRNKFRLKNIGFIFQDFKLFNLDNVFHNVAFPISIKNGTIGIRSKRRILDLLTLVGLLDKEKQSVKNLSGGEKQRVAIARALSNDPKLILADEPTGALDEENAHKVMDILKKISEDKLVIVVSHDKELVNEYADKVIELKDGKIKEIYENNQGIHANSLDLIKEDVNNKHSSIPPLFLLRHTLSSIKERKWRTLLINSVTSLGLIGVGLAFSLSSSISSNIKEACTNLFNDNQVMLSKKEVKDNYTVEGASYDEMLNIKTIYKEEVESVRCIYQTNFNNIFKDKEDISIYSNKTKIELSNYSFKQINDYYKLPDESLTIYPSYPESLNSDEVVISLSLSNIYNICFSLKIIRTVESFIDYMKSNDVYLSIHVVNNDWQYEDRQIFKLKGFTLDYEARIYHYNPLWNEDVIENTMRFPSSINLSTKDEKPWTLKKLYYLELYDDVDRDIFLNKVRYHKEVDNYLFEIATNQYFPLSIKEEDDFKKIKRLIVFKKYLDNISPRIVNAVTSYFPDCKEAILGSYGGYLIHKDALMMGFSNFTYFSSNHDLLVETLEEYSSLPTLANQNIDLNEDIKVGHYSKSLQNGVVFKQIPEKMLSGRKPNNLDEIVISSKLHHSFSDVSSNTLSIGVTSKEEKVNKDKTIREFKIVDLHIVGIVESDDYAIYHNVDWPIDFYQSRVGVSIFSLGINTICFSLADDVDMDKLVTSMKKAFPEYEVTNPLSSINEGIDDVCYYLELAMVAFSSIAIVISIFLLSMCNYLHALEIKNDIGLARCIGVSGLESTKFVFYHSYVMGFIALLTAILELVVTSYFISYSVAHQLSVSFIFTFNPIGILYMFLLTLVISTISSLFISIKVLRFSPLNSLRAV